MAIRGGVREPGDEPGPEPLARDDADTWRLLQPLMEHGPDRRWAVRGTIVSVEPGRADLVTRVWLDGSRARLEHADGTLSFLTDGARTWRFWDRPAPIEDEGRGQGGEDGGDLAFRRSSWEAMAFGFGVPVGPIRSVLHVGRPAWAFSFWPPRSKPSAMHVIVDAATGLVLHKHFADAAVHREWSELEELEELPAELFTWTGPVITRAALKAEQEAEHERDMAARARWFREKVTATPLDVRGPVDVLVHAMSRGGGFFASLSGPIEGAVARRPRATTRWRVGMSTVDHAWSDERWQWALSVWDDELTPEELASLQGQLGSTPE